MKDKKGETGKREWFKDSEGTASEKRRGEVDFSPSNLLYNIEQQMFYTFKFYNNYMCELFPYVELHQLLIVFSFSCCLVSSFSAPNT